MGSHYVPQQYLKGFSDPENPGMIWMYDKKLHQFMHASIVSVAQQVGYYSPETERLLSEIVEGPANQALNRVRREKKVTDNNRMHLTLYIGTMLKRVPRRRRKAAEMLPKILEDTIRNFKAKVEAWARASRADPKLVARRIAEIDRVYEAFRRELPSELIEQIRTPWPGNRIVALLYAMQWRITSTDGPIYFLTSDNPAYFFEAYGLGKPESELTFPLTSDMALLAAWQGPGEGTFFVPCTQALVKEVNRRVASGAERFVFYHERRDWVASLSDKKRPYLSRIQW
jgi:hypothetical protein